MDRRHIVILCAIIGMSFYLCLPNFVAIGRLMTELWCHIKFSSWRHTVGNLLPGSGLWLRYDLYFENFTK